MPIGIKGFQKGQKFTEEHKLKLSISHKGKKHTDEHKKNNSEVHKGMKYNAMSEIGRIHLSESHKGIKHTKKWKIKMSKMFKGRKLSKEWKKKIGKSNSGENSNWWKGGISPLRLQILNCFNTRQWRSDVFTRDNFTCQKCDSKSGNGKAIYLEAHHKKSFSKIIEENYITSLEQALDCDELWNINNGITLCKVCHGKTNNYGSKSYLNERNN